MLLGLEHDHKNTFDKLVCENINFHDGSNEANESNQEEAGSSKQWENSDMVKN
jgi:hypothetical protein